MGYFLPVLAAAAVTIEVLRRWWYQTPDQIYGTPGPIYETPTSSRSHEPPRTNRPDPASSRSNETPRANRPDPTSSSSSPSSSRTRDTVPHVLTQPLTAPTYSAYFAALLNAEESYIEKWNGFQMFRVTLQLDKKNKDSRTKSVSGNKKVYVAFEIDSVPERRPFLLSKDSVSIKPAGTGIEVEPFKGYISRVVTNTRVLAAFGDGFFSQYSPDCKYDVVFSFNKVPLKREHEAVAAASAPSFQTFLFPDSTSRISYSIPISVIHSNRNLGPDQVSAISQILSVKGPPYLVEGPCSITNDNRISRTGDVIIEATLQIYRASPYYRVLIVAPTNRTCDMLMESLQLQIPGSEIFRANAAFRDPNEIPEDILSSSVYKWRFTCPPLPELQKYKVITSTYASSFKLRTAGISAGHFSHIFLVDASSVTEPETMVVLTNLANESTTVVVTGTLKDQPVRVRSDIARRKGLKISYFERLLISMPYCLRDLQFVKYLWLVPSES